MYCKNLFFSGRTFSLPISRCMIRTKHYEAIFIFFILFIGFLVSNQLIIGKASVLWRFVLSCLMVHACTILRCMYRVPLFEALPPTLWDCHLRYKHKIKQNRAASGAHVGAICFSSYWVICSDTMSHPFEVAFWARQNDLRVTGLNSQVLCSKWFHHVPSPQSQHHAIASLQSQW